ncbi:hypothetical protein Pfo_029766 [Paulownia fortunei]|nr:hypothetical protein Pfo_029766 [Paulownia fortunei]
MVKVIEEPRLERLELKELLRLETFCQWRCGFELPSLKSIFINKCPRMEIKVDPGIPKYIKPGIHLYITSCWLTGLDMTTIQDEIAEDNKNRQAGEVD